MNRTGAVHPPIESDGSTRLNLLKAGFAALVVVCITLLLALNRIDDGAGFGLLGTICGYVLANGVNARLGRDAAPLIQPAPVVYGRRDDDYRDG